MATAWDTGEAAIGAEVAEVADRAGTTAGMVVATGAKAEEALARTAVEVDGTECATSSESDMKKLSRSGAGSTSSVRPGEDGH